MTKDQQIFVYDILLTIFGVVTFQKLLIFQYMEISDVNSFLYSMTEPPSKLASTFYLLVGLEIMVLIVERGFWASFLSNVTPFK